jgi:hypothetical protein
VKTKIAVISVLLVLVALFLFGCWKSPVSVLQETAILPPKFIERTGQDLSLSQDLPFTKASLTAEQLATAILTLETATLLTAATMSGVAAQFEVYTSSLQDFPTDGLSYALMSTGNASGIAGSATTFYDYATGGPTSPPYSHRNNPSYDIATLSLTLSVPAGATTLSFDWKFGTEENPTYIGSFVDWASAIVTTSAGSTNILLLPDGKPVDVDNTVPFSNAVTGSSNFPDPPYPSPNDTVYNAVTGMYTSTFDVAPFVGEAIRIDFQVGDENDQNLDSALFIDNLNIGLGIISDPRERAAAALKAVEEFYGLFTLPDNFPKSIILAVIAGETGRNYDFNNVLISCDWGRGLMQITTNNFVGAGSGGCDSNYCWDCRERNEEACYSYYSNTQEGINKNIRDGYYALAEKYGITGYCANCTGYENITPEEICWISVVQQYNTGYREHPSEYTSHIGEILKNSLSWNWYYTEGVEDDPGLGNKFIEAYNNREEVILCSSAYLLVYDSQGRATGLIEGEVAQEIPNSIYDPNSFYDREREIVVIFFPIDSYRYEVVGREEGTYSLTINSAKEGEITFFEAIDIPTSAGVVHQYTIDWDILSQGEEGVTVQMDFDGDGTPELTITTDSTFTFIPAAIDIDPDTLNLKSKIKWVTAYIELPGGYDVADIDVGTVKLWYEDNSVPAEWGDIQDGTLMVKFNGKAVQDLFTGPVDAATVAVAGELQDGTPFGGNDTIMVIEKP